VSPDGNGDIDCGDFSKPCADIKWALHQSASLILAFPGVYQLSEALVFANLAFNTTLRSIEPGGAILECQGRHCVVMSYAGRDAVTFEGFVFQSSAPEPESLVFIDTGNPRFVDCHFREGSAISGGCVLIEDQGISSFVGCTFEGCRASVSGGAIHHNGLGVVLIEDCLFQKNVVSFLSTVTNNLVGGGALFFRSERLTVSLSCACV